jgi:hypothetical protein
VVVELLAPKKKVRGSQFTFQRGRDFFWRTTDQTWQPRLKARHGWMHAGTVPHDASHAASLPCCAHDRDMLDFMENVQHAFYEASHWNVDNSYGALNATARGRFHSTFLAALDTDVYV